MWTQESMERERDTRLTCSLLHRSMALQLILLTALLCAIHVHSDLIKGQSFIAPFTEVDRNGQFTVPSKHYIGVVWLTPDYKSWRANYISRNTPPPSCR